MSNTKENKNLKHSSCGKCIHFLIGFETSPIQHNNKYMSISNVFYSFPLWLEKY